jgi:hypothetical protein
MSRLNKNLLVSIFFAACAGGIFADYDYFDNFPAMCSEASNRHPLPGHIMRLGFVAPTSFGWSFLFPERNSTDMLERVSLLDNAGLIGQPPDQFFGDQIRMRTPAGYFVVAHIFVGDQNSEPVVTCVSGTIPAAQYQPSYYGEQYEWLTSQTFGAWLNFRKFGKWKWRRYWNFDDVRSGFHSFWKKQGASIYKKFKEYHKWRDRDHKPGDDARKFRRINDDKPIVKVPDAAVGAKLPMIPKIPKVIDSSKRKFDRDNIGIGVDKRVRDGKEGGAPLGIMPTTGRGAFKRPDLEIKPALGKPMATTSAHGMQRQGVQPQGPIKKKRPQTEKQKTP